jgi:hypothetical protein
MNTETIVAISSTVINFAVTAGVWKLYGEYKDYNKETSWKNVKEHYEEIRIPNEIAKAQKEFEANVNQQFAEVQPQLDELFITVNEMARLITHVLVRIDKADGQKLVSEHMPSAAQYFQNIWAFHDEHKPVLPKIL